MMTTLLHQVCFPSTLCSSMRWAGTDIGFTPKCLLKDRGRVRFFYVGILPTVLEAGAVVLMLGNTDIRHHFISL